MLPHLGQTQRAVLKLLSSEDQMYGYAIYTHALQNAKKSLTLSSVYDALRNLRRRKLVQAQRKIRVNGRLRRFYTITDLGRDALAKYPTNGATL